ncbi:MAG TPA: CHAT domain-containing protein [Longimicrobium sp.]|jgi:CHAT domain-containing protein/tetratricopeptide (TPR) repeat protein
MQQAEERKHLLAEATRLYDQGRPAEALPLFAQCLSLFGEEDRSSVEYADFCGNYGSALAESGNLKLAERMFNAALLVYGSRGQKAGVARTHFNLGNVYGYMNSRQRCSDHYRHALEAYRDCKDARGEGATLLQLANHYAGMGVFDEARERLKEFEGLDERVRRDPELRRSWRFQQAKIALHDGQPAQALTHLEEALDCARQTGVPDYVEEAESALAQVRRMLGGTQEEELPALERAYQASKERQDRHLLERAYELARALAAKGEWERALALYDECLDLVDTRRGSLDGAERFHWMEQLAGVSQEYAALLFRHGRAEQALEASERGQGRALLDLMFRHRIKLQGERTIRAADNGRVTLDAPRRAEIRSALRDADAHLFKILETGDTALAWLAGPDGRVDAWDAGPARAALERVIGLLLPPDEAGSPPPAGEAREVRAHGPAARVSWDELQQALAALYQALFPAGVRERLESGEGRLLVVPHRSYFHVPWAALGPAEGPSLGARWQVCVTPSVGVFMQLDRRRDPEAWRGLAGFQVPAAAIGDCGPQTVEIPAFPLPDAPTFSLSFCELPGTREEVRRVAELLDGAVFTGPQAHPAAVRAAATAAGVLHLATHGYWHLVSGELSFLVLAPSPAPRPGAASPGGGPGALFAYQLMGDDFTTRAELVTLSGCQTGLGSPHPDTYINLAHSFLVAGARCVLVSLWPIRDDAAAAFMEEFYLGLREGGRSPAEALQLAQAEMRRSILWSEGWNWSGFVLVGNAFHGFAPEPDGPRFPGPAFCGGDVLWEGEPEGAVLPLQNFAGERQAGGEGWLVSGERIVKIRKR